jgi:hypothetical protein
MQPYPSPSNAKAAAIHSFFISESRHQSGAIPASDGLLLEVRSSAWIAYALRRMRSQTRHNQGSCGCGLWDRRSVLGNWLTRVERTSTLLPYRQHLNVPRLDRGRFLASFPLLPAKIHSRRVSIFPTAAKASVGCLRQAHLLYKAGVSPGQRTHTKRSVISAINSVSIKLYASDSL